MRFQRRFTCDNEDPYAGLEFESRASEIKNPDGSVVHAVDDVTVPSNWSQVSVDVLAQKYLRRTGVPQTDADGEVVRGPDGEPVLGPERDLRQVVDRMAGCWTSWGQQYDYFASKDDATAFRDELRYMLARQMGKRRRR